MNENNFDYEFKIIFFGDSSSNKPKIKKCFADNFSEEKLNKFGLSYVRIIYINIGIKNYKY